MACETISFLGSVSLTISVSVSVSLSSRISAAGGDLQRPLDRNG